MSVPSSFHFVKAIREQMYESRDMTNIPVIVVANKMDLVASKNYQPPPNQQLNTVPLHSFNSSNHIQGNSLLELFQTVLD